MGKHATIFTPTLPFCAMQILLALPKMIMLLASATLDFLIMAHSVPLRMNASIAHLAHSMPPARMPRPGFSLANAKTVSLGLEKTAFKKMRVQEMAPDVTKMQVAKTVQAFIAVNVWLDTLEMEHFVKVLNFALDSFCIAIFLTNILAAVNQRSCAYVIYAFLPYVIYQDLF